MPDHMGKFIVPVRKISSNATEQGFLWQQGNIFVMHNHVHALWCWLQSEILTRKRGGLIHIDYHSDFASIISQRDIQKLNPVFNEICKIKNISIFDSYSVLSNDKAGVGWDTFITVASEAGLFSEYHMFCTDLHTDYPESESIRLYKYQKTSDLSKLENAITSSGDCVIVDIDLDYFDHEFSPERCADSAVESIGKILHQYIDRIIQITIAVSTSSGDGPNIVQRRIRHLKILSSHLEFESHELCVAIDNV